MSRIFCIRFFNYIYFTDCKYNNNMRTPLNAGTFKKWKEKARIWLHLSNTRLLSGLLLKKIYIKENMMRTLKHEHISKSIQNFPLQLASNFFFLFFSDCVNICGKRWKHMQQRYPQISQDSMDSMKERAFKVMLNNSQI